MKEWLDEDMVLGKLSIAWEDNFSRFDSAKVRRKEFVKKTKTLLHEEKNRSSN